MVSALFVYIYVCVHITICDCEFVCVCVCVCVYVSLCVHACVSQLSARIMIMKTFAFILLVCVLQ